MLGVALELDDLQAVEQRRLDRAQLVGRGDEQDLAQVEGQVEVVVAEGVVLGRVEHLKQRRGRVALEARGDLVQLVEDEDRVPCADPPQALDDPPRHRADVRPPVAADLRLVAHAAQAEPLKLAAQRARDRLAQARLTHPRRADEAEDRAPDIRLQLVYGEVFEDPVLDLAQAVVVLVEDPRGAPQVEVVGGHLVPRQLKQQFEVGADDMVLGGRRRDRFEPPQLAPRGRLGLLGQRRLGDPLGQVGRRLGRRVGLAQLGADGLQLLAQEILALGAVHLARRLALQLAAQLEDLQLAADHAEDRLEAGLEVRRGEHLVPLVVLHAHAGRQHVGQLERRLDALDRLDHVLVRLRDQLGQAAESALHGAHERGDHVAVGLGHRRGHDLGPGGNRVHRVADDADALQAVQQDLHRPVGQPAHTRHDPHAAVLAQLAAALGLVVRHVRPRNHRQPPLAALEGLVNRLDRRVVLDLERQEQAREEHQLGHRQQVHLAGPRLVEFGVVVGGALVGLGRGVDRLGDLGHLVHQAFKVAVGLVVAHSPSPTTIRRGPGLAARTSMVKNPSVHVARRSACSSDSGNSKTRSNGP